MRIKKPSSCPKDLHLGVLSNNRLLQWSMLSASIAVDMGCLDPEILFLEIYPKETI